MMVAKRKLLTYSRYIQFLYDFCSFVEKEDYKEIALRCVA